MESGAHKTCRSSETVQARTKSHTRFRLAPKSSTYATAYGVIKQC